ncbi:hypothetical protein B0H19DRAFT_1229131 [Mycena capillaripes]|nr:hypothetical protein B0H19DRAFT_1229131 [Mycena capillaripes]
MHGKNSIASSPGVGKAWRELGSCSTFFYFSSMTGKQALMALEPLFLPWSMEKASLLRRAPATGHPHISTPRKSIIASDLAVFPDVIEMLLTVCIDRSAGFDLSCAWCGPPAGLFRMVAGCFRALRHEGTRRTCTGPLNNEPYISTKAVNPSTPRPKISHHNVDYSEIDPDAGDTLSADPEDKIR